MTTTRRFLPATLAILLSGCGGVSPIPAPTLDTGLSTAPSVTTTIGPIESASAHQTSEPTAPIATATAFLALDLPSHGRIAFNLSFGPNANTGTYIETVEPTGGDLRVLTHPTAGCDRDPAWSPAGDHIYFGVGVPPAAGCDGSTSQYLASMNADGSSVRRLTKPFTGVFDDAAAVSPDGKRIAFARFDLRHKLTGIWLMNVDGSDLVRVTTTPPEAAAGGDQSPAFSPDGSELVFARDRSDNGDGAIYIVGINGSGLRQVVPDTLDAARPAFSPDGSKILFSNLDSASPSLGQNVYLVNVDGSDPRNLTHEGSQDSAGDAAWSPDGTMIVFRQYHAGDNFVALAVMSADGSTPSVIWHPTPSTDMFPGAPAWGSAP